MLNKNNERELAYIVKVDAITPMDADRLECAHVGGWHCVVGKGEFQVGDFGVYFEIDSKLPEIEPFMSMEFLKSKHYKIKSQKIRGEISQGLLMPISAFGWSISTFPKMSDIVLHECVIDKNGNAHLLDDDSRFLTQQLEVTYAIAEDNQRKSSSVDKYKKMAQRHPNLARTAWWRRLYRLGWGKKLLFVFFGKKKDKKNGWPAWVVKTDEERCQNMPWLFNMNNNNEEWIATEKVDGTSTTFTMKGFGRKREFYVCSRNVVFDKPDKQCYYDTNVYLEMAEKYNIKEVLAKTLDKLHNEKDKEIEFVTIQGETFGAGVQKRDYGMTNHDMVVFNIIYGYKDGSTIRLNPIQGKEAAENAGLKYVPIVDEHFKLPNTCEELLKIATGESKIDGEMREGLVFRSVDGVKSFKAVSNEFLLKYHQ